MNHLKLGLGLAGFVLALLSVAFQERRLGWAAIALLVGSLILRHGCASGMNGRRVGMSLCDAYHR